MPIFPNIFGWLTKKPKKLEGLEQKASPIEASTTSAGNTKGKKILFKKNEREASAGKTTNKKSKESKVIPKAAGLTLEKYNKLRDEFIEGFIVGWTKCVVLYNKKEQKVRGEGYEIPETPNEIELYEIALVSWLDVTGYVSDYELAAFSSHSSRSAGAVEGFTTCNNILTPWLSDEGKNAHHSKKGYDEGMDEFP